MTVNERIKFILDKKKIGYGELAESLKVTQAAISNRLNRGKEINDKDFINKVVSISGVPLEAFTSDEGFHKYFFSTNYDGYIPLSDVDQTNVQEQELRDYPTRVKDLSHEKLLLRIEIESLKRELAAKDETIKSQSETIEIQKRMIAERDEDIRILTSDAQKL